MTAVIAVGLFWINKLTILPFVHLVTTLSFFSFLTLFVYTAAFFSQRYGSKTALSVTLITFGIRLAVSLSYLLVYYKIFGFNSLKFTIIFLSLYLLFTVFEIYHLVYNLRTDLKNTSNKR